MLKFVFPRKIHRFCNKHKEVLLQYFFYKELLFFKRPINFKQLLNTNVPLNRKLDLYTYRFNNYYNFFSFPLKFLVKNLSKINSYIFSVKKSNNLYNSLLLKKKKYLIFFNVLYSLFIFQKNKELFEMETFFFKQLQLKYNYKFLTTKKVTELNLLSVDSILFLTCLLKKYISVLMIPFFVKILPVQIKKLILKKKKINFSKKLKLTNTLKLSKKKIKRLVFATKKNLILNSLRTIAKLKTNEKILLLFFKKSFSNIFITLTDVNLNVIVCKTSTISGIIGNKRRKVAPQAIEYIISSLKYFFVKNIFICLNLRSNIRKYLYTLVRELNLNNINIKGFFRFCLRAHNGVRGRTSLKKL